MKRKCKRVTSLLLTICMVLGLWCIPANAGKRETPTPAYSNAFHKDANTTFSSVSTAYGWDLNKNGKNNWTSDITGEEMEWSEGNQLQFYYDNSATTTQHVWNISGVMGGSYGSLGLPVGSGSNIVEHAISQLGVRESPSNSNCVSFVRWFNGWGSDVPLSSYEPYNWCCIFVVWCATQCGYIDSGLFMRTGGCTQQFEYMTQTMDYSYCSVQDVWNGRESNVQPGDILFFKKTDSSNPNKMGHIGIVVSYDAEAKELLVIEGNTNGSCAPDGVGTPGGGVSYQLYRPTTNYSAMQRGYIVRPPYPAADGEG